MAKRTFTKDYLREILWEEIPGKVHDEITDHGRWDVGHYMVFLADDGNHYGVGYSVGATEYQDVTPFEFEPNEIECDKVALVEKVVKDWCVVE